jgi:hypothetical protein
MSSGLGRAIKFGILLGLLGYFVSAPWVLRWLAAQDPNLDFVLWYGLLAVWSAAAYYVLFGKMITVKLSASFLLFYFAIGTVFYWAASSAALANAGIATTGTVPAFLLASEDQLISSFFLWLGAPVWLAVILTYVVVPAVLAVIALVLAGPKATRMLKSVF